MSAEQTTTYCIWMLNLMGGAGTTIDCSEYGYSVDIATLSQCESGLGGTDFGTCTVGIMEDWAASRGSACDLLFGGDPDCISG